MLPFLALGALSAANQVVGGFAQAEAIRDQAREQNRRNLLQAAQAVGQASALGAASGIETTSKSLQTYLADMTAEYRRQAEWSYKAARAQATSVEQAAVVGGVTSLAGGFFKQGQASNWWKEPALAPSTPATVIDLTGSKPGSGWSAPQLRLGIFGGGP